MKHLAINSDAVKEIISGNRIYSGTKSFCELRPIIPMQHIEAAAFLIGEFLDDKKNRLLNFIGRLKIKWRTLTKKITVPHR